MRAINISEMELNLLEFWMLTALALDRVTSCSRLMEFPYLN